MSPSGARQTGQVWSSLDIRWQHKHLPDYTLWIKRIEHRKWIRGCNGLHQLGQPVAPSVLFPVFNPPYPQGTCVEHHNKQLKWPLIRSNGYQLVRELLNRYPKLRALFRHLKSKHKARKRLHGVASWRQNGSRRRGRKPVFLVRLLVNEVCWNVLFRTQSRIQISSDKSVQIWCPQKNNVDDYWCGSNSFYSFTHLSRHSFLQASNARALEERSDPHASSAQSAADPPPGQPCLLWVFRCFWWSCIIVICPSEFKLKSIIIEKAMN